MNKTGIEYLDYTWNPTSGCTPISAGCQNCWAEKMASRLQAMGTKGYENGFKPTFHRSRLFEPLKKKKPSRIGVSFMGDLFHPQIPFDWVRDVLSQTMTPSGEKHTYLILTKRPERMLEFYNKYKWYGENVKNIWAGVTAENQQQADGRIPILLQIPAAVRFVSVEPMLGPVDLTKYIGVSNAVEKHRREGIQSCNNGGTGNRQSRKDMASSLPQGKQMYRRHPNNSMQTSKSREKNRKIPADQGDDKPKESKCISAQDGVETFFRADTKGDDDQSQKRHPVRQQTGKPGTCNIFRSKLPCNSYLGSPPKKKPPRSVCWVICGGESGPGARPMHPDWARELRDQCVAASVPYFFKQWGEYHPLTDNFKKSAKVVCGCGWSGDARRTPEMEAHHRECQQRASMLCVYKVGKKKAGRFLNGELWNQYPSP